ncbi:TraR/DksA C4-type zinc finger protein, partial [Escherichia coli]|nr:TraR/DksA C4-type zinc finger protein [Escherichia coli]
NQESRLPPGSDFRRWVWITIAPFVTCCECGDPIDERRRLAVQGCRTCASCQEVLELISKQRGSK